MALDLCILVGGHIISLRSIVGLSSLCPIFRSAGHRFKAPSTAIIQLGQ